MPQRLAILGSTGSIGKQTLDICRVYPELFTVEVLTAGSNADLLINQALEFNPNMVVIGNEDAYESVSEALRKTDIKVFCGGKSIAEAAGNSEVDTVVLAMVGISGLEPAISALKAGKKLALANKEVLVVAGELVTRLSIEHNAPIIPIDSEHSAIMQCLQGESSTSIEKLILTASGGPFRGFNAPQLQNVTLQQALDHPVWSMGNKITIDSATLMNKGFEVIEARWLFNIAADRIDILVHPQSIIHSMVQFVDGSIKAQLSKPDMRLPILYALTWPQRLKAPFQTGGLSDIASLTFEKADTSAFRHLAMAYESIKIGGGAPCVLNAANEIAVDLFLQEKISFPGMQNMVNKALERLAHTKALSIQELLLLDAETRTFCKSLNNI
ncbi:MAG: 1-deoxy-D-xylulose-5-phosphate reductoisomerase [Bacteroidetes bacterium HGW-Bacteroidetes-6]|jgi:1-deoxy-D-xylulose-5-phosphate reductoisomerase|nr:MAG: 1-deoxy-D-xylulose-5-phosphate reductoisomerase [Bacteroidetes bacterium HGW-Bacteroidetes-6]